MFKKISLKLILFYKSSLSPYLGGNCKYEPACSSYGFEAINNYGFLIILLPAKEVYKQIKIFE